MINSLSQNDKIAKTLVNRINLILKGEYKSDQWGEKLIFKGLRSKLNIRFSKEGCDKLKPINRKLIIQLRYKPIFQ